MDQHLLDRASKVLAGATTRRAGIKTALALIVAPATVAVAAPVAKANQRQRRCKINGRYCNIHSQNCCPGLECRTNPQTEKWQCYRQWGS